MSGKRVLVTGAGGFVGGALARGFSELGWQVAGLDRSFDAPENTKGADPMVRVTADVAEGVPGGVTPVDLVVHAAWVTSDPATLGVTPAAYLAMNLRPLISVLEYATHTRPSAFVFLSSSGVFSPDDAEHGLTDAHDPSGTSAYAAAKRAAEVLVPAALEQGRADAQGRVVETACHVVRLGHLYGPGEISRPSRAGVSLVAAWLEAARNGQPLEVRPDDPTRDWTFTPDVAPALERLAAGPSAGHPVHLGSPFAYRDQAVAKLVADAVAGSQASARSSVPSEVVTRAGGAVPAPVKAPMVPSDIAALRDFPWTDLPAGLRALVSGEAPA